MKASVSLMLAVVFLALWVALAFVVKIPSGWVHVPLGLGATLVAVAIIESRPSGK
jgi:hypothetical protein